ncbi:hypothetical protein ACOI9R_36855, partial [Mesorhizobium japonicum]
AATRRAIVDGLSSLQDADALVAIVGSEGRTTGSAAPEVTARIVAQLRAGRDVSTSVRRGGSTYLVEGRATSDGGGVVAAQEANAVGALSPTVLWRLVIALGIGFVVALIAAVIASRALSRPLVRLAGVARRLARGERGVPLESSPIAEVADVESALGSLDAALAHS